jgi:DNA-binding CsgD family transcriptional regulator
VTNGKPALFVGRQAEMEWLTARARQAVRGRGAAVLVDGEPGIGKTVLLAAVAAECARRGMRVLRGGAGDLERRLPFALVAECLRSGGAAAAEDEDDVAAEVTALLRGEGAGRTGAAANHEFVVVEAILDLMDRWYAQGPVALLVDDVQWADPSSLTLLHRLARTVTEQPLLLVVAVGPVAPDDTVAGLARGLVANGARALTLGPLAEPAVAALVAHRLGAPAGPALLDLVRGASGNPMYVAEVVEALARDGAIRTTGGVAELVADLGTGAGRWIPPSLVDAVQEWLDFLPREVRRTLEMAAVLGPTVDVTELSTILDVSVVALLGVVDRALAAGLLVDTGWLLVFRHELIREALAAHQPASARAALRLRAGQVLAAAGAPVERVAEYLLAGTAFDRRGTAWLLGAADALIVRAPELAVALLRRALAANEGGTEGATEGATERAGLRFHLVRGLLWTGALAEAEHAAQAALAADPEPSRDGPLRWMLAQARYRQGRVGEVVATVTEALASAHLAPAEAGRFHGLAALCHVVLEQYEACDAAARKAVAAGTASRDAVATGYGYHMLAAGRLVRGELRRALELVDLALAASGTGAQADLELDPWVIRAECLIGLDRLAEADDALANAVRHNQRAGGVHLTLDHATRARLRFLDGRWDDALAEIRTGLELPDPYRFGVAFPALAALVAVHRGERQVEPDVDSDIDSDVDNDLDDNDLDDNDDSVGGRSYRCLRLWATALAEEARGEARRAFDLLYPTWDHPTGPNPRRLVYLLCPDLARLAAATGDRDRLRDLAATTAALAAQEPSGSVTATALLCQGLAADDPEALLAAARAFEEAGRPLYEGYGYEHAAALFAQHGRRTEARDALDRALARYAALDAAWDSTRARARLRLSGVRPGHRGAHKRPRQGWAALTDTEHKVALLVAEGRSNPEIAAQMYLSRRTVQTHVSNILAKLGIGSRVELAVRASRGTGG